MSAKQSEAHSPHDPWTALPTWAREPTRLNVVIETVQGSRNKLKLDPKRGVFTISSVLPAGSEFPYDFGFVPSTLGDDGDPLDALVLMDAPTVAGCLIECRVLGVLEARQADDGDTLERNDRLITTAVESHRYCELQKLDELGAQLLTEIQHFFVQYNAARRKVFKPLGYRGPKVAAKLIRAGMKRHRKEQAT